VEIPEYLINYRKEVTNQTKEKENFNEVNLTEFLLSAGGDIYRDFNGYRFQIKIYSETTRDFTELQSIKSDWTKWEEFSKSNNRFSINNDVVNEEQLRDFLKISTSWGSNHKIEK
jgi:hypothetical protein